MRINLTKSEIELPGWPHKVMTFRYKDAEMTDERVRKVDKTHIVLWSLLCEQDRQLRNMRHELEQLAKRKAQVDLAQRRYDALNAAGLATDADSPKTTLSLYGSHRRQAPVLRSSVPTLVEKGSLA
jgi:hypothetical protein